MSLSEALGSLPVVRHFYPIDPVTSSQQSAFVYNPPSAPIVAPIQPYTFPQPREPKAKPVKRKLDEDELEVEGLVPSTSIRLPKRSKIDDRPSQKRDVDVVPIRLPPRARRHMPYISLPATKSLDKSLYGPLSQSSYGAEYLKLGRGERTSKRPARLATWTPSTSPLSEASHHSYDPDSDSDYSFRPTKTQAKAKGKRIVKKRQVKQEPESTRIILGEDLETSCHQCRRKNMIPKMGCHHVNPRGTVCGLLFCQPCISSRYGEDFEPEHRSWNCPRCRDICNCSICLRKVGLGYLLENGGSGKRGYLIMDGKTTRSKKHDNGLRQISARQWLARRGLLVGNDAWMEEQQRKGVRYFIGKKPPPLDGSSPYKEARFSHCLAAHEDQKAVDDIGFPLDPQLMGEGGIVPRVEAPTLVREDDSAGPSLETEAGAPTSVNAPAFPATPKRHTPSTSPPEGYLSRDMPEYTSGALYGDTEDLPGLTTAQTRRVRLIVGSPLPASQLKKREKRKIKILGRPKKRKVESDDDYGEVLSKPKKRKVESDDDYGEVPSRMTGLKIRLPAIRVSKQHTIPPAVPSLEDDEKIEYKDEQPEAGSSYSDSEYGHSEHGHSEHGQTFLEDGDAPATPPPPPQEPVFVPTEHYAPSKLDIAYVKDPNARFSQSYWDTLNAFNSQTDAEKQAQMLFSYDGPGADDLSPSHSGSTTVSTHPSSSSRTLNDFLVPQRDVGYAASGLSSFAALEETWIGGSSGIGMDIPSLHLEHLMRGTE